MLLKRLNIICLLLFLASIPAVYAEAAASEIDSKQDAEAIQTEEKNIEETIAGLVFVGPAINLSLEQALSISLTSGASVKAAEIQKKSDAANAKANAEAVSNMNEVKRRS